MNKFRRWLALAMAMVMVLALCAGCANGNNGNSGGGSGGGGGDANPSGSGAADTIRVGFVGPLTGDAAAWGIAQLKAIQIRVDKCNKDGGLLGKQIELFYYDNREDAVETVNAARKLIENDKVVAILGPNNSVCAQAMSSVCDDYKVPMICTNTPLEQITLDDNGNVRPYVFRAIMIQRAYVAPLCSYLYNDLGLRNAAILYRLSEDTHVVFNEQFKNAWEALGGTIVASETTASADDVDFRAQLTKINQANPEVIITPFTYKQIILMAQQARELGFKGMFAGADTWYQVNIPSSAGEQVAGCAAIASLDINSEKLDPIKAEWLEYWGEDQTLRDGGTDPYYGYDAWKMLEAAILDAGAADSDSIRDALENIKDVEGCVGLLSMDPATHNPSRELALMTIEKNDSGEYAYVTLGTIYNGEIILNK